MMGEARGTHLVPPVYSLLSWSREWTSVADPVPEGFDPHDLRALGNESVVHTIRKATEMSRGGS